MSRYQLFTRMQKNCGKAALQIALSNLSKDVSEHQGVLRRLYPVGRRTLKLDAPVSRQIGDGDGPGLTWDVALPEENLQSLLERLQKNRSVAHFDVFHYPDNLSIDSKYKARVMGEIEDHYARAKKNASESHLPESDPESFDLTALCNDVLLKSTGGVP